LKNREADQEHLITLYHPNDAKNPRVKGEGSMYVPRRREYIDGLAGL
jgi:hypothetical protein